MGIATAIGAAAVIGGSVLSSKSANKNAKRAAQVSQDNNTQNVALQRDVYNQNKAALSPFMARGNAAGDQINALLGLGGGTPQYQQPAPQPNALSQFYGGTGPMANMGIGVAGFPARDGVSAAAGYGIADGQAGMGGLVNLNGVDYGPAGGRYTMGYGDWVAQNTGAPTPTAQQAQNSAFDTFRNSTGYQFRLGEGMNALNSGYAGAGVLQSGDAMRSAVEYGQNFASGEFGNYMGMLANQQGVGLSGASAVAGVGQNYANNITQMNTQNAANQANAILSKQNVLGNALGTIGGGMFNYGMGKI